MLGLFGNVQDLVGVDFVWMVEYWFVGFEDFYVGVGIVVFGFGDGVQGVVFFYGDEVCFWSGLGYGDFVFY